MVFFARFCSSLRYQRRIAGQIASKGYGAQVRAHGHVKKLLQVCMAFCGKEVALAYRQVTV